MHMSVTCSACGNYVRSDDCELDDPADADEIREYLSGYGWTRRPGDGADLCPSCARAESRSNHGNHGMEDE